jgi:hypothetical protein
MLWTGAPGDRRAGQVPGAKFHVKYREPAPPINSWSPAIINPSVPESMGGVLRYRLLKTVLVTLYIYISMA